MRTPKLCSGADPARTNDKDYLRQNEVAQTERFLQRDAAFFDIAFCAIELSRHEKIVGQARRLPNRKFLAGEAPALQSVFGIDLVFVLWSLGRHWFVAKSAVPNSAAGVRDVPTGSQRHTAKQNHRDYERQGRSWPFHWRRDCNRTQSCKGVENPDEILGAIPVLIEPGVSIFIRHRQDAIIRLLAKFIDRPRRDGADEDEH